MRFYNHKSSAIFEIYLQLYDSELSFEKKKLIFKSLLVGESWSWKITGISKLCLESFKKNKFEKSRKLKTKRINSQTLITQLKIFLLPKEQKKNGGIKF